MILSSDRGINGAREVDMMYLDQVYCSTIQLAIRVCKDRELQKTNLKARSRHRFVHPL